MENQNFKPIVDILSENLDTAIAMDGEDYVVLATNEKVAKKEIDKAVISQEAQISEYEDKKYQRLRAKEYPSLEEQEDMKYWDTINGTSIWLDTITEIKEKYPKG